MSARLPVLFLRMLRYRVAVLLWLFMLIGAARHGGLDAFRPGYVWAALSLACCYVVATCLNDVADRDVDAVNHPRDAGRPLVSGHATERELRTVAAAAAPPAAALALPLGIPGMALAALSLLTGYGYSLGAARLSYRTYAAPLALSVAYVLVPYLFGVLAAGGRPARPDLALGAALYLLFLARIVLKDFRDREGDARYGKPTLLLRYGKDVTCLLSLVLLAAGTAALLLALRPGWVLAALLGGYAAAIASRLYALWRSVDRRREQLAIGVGARAGNGLLICALAVLVLAARGAPQADTVAVVAVVTAGFAVDFALLVARPQEAVIGYKA